MSKRQLSLGEVFPPAKMRSVDVEEQSPVFQSYLDDTAGSELGQTIDFEELEVDPPVLVFQPELKISDSVRPFDVSKTLTDNLYQPKLSVFPTRNGKRFQRDWYMKFPWIEYSQERDSVFCFACSHFPQHDTPDNFTSIGFHDWNHGVQKLQKHSDSFSHKTSVMAKIQQESTKGSITTQVQAISLKQLEENRHYVRTVAEVVELCARQGLALRGHRESEGERNRGNFLEILTLISKKDSIVRSKLEGAKYARYTHHDIQNEIIETFSSLIKKDILNDVQISKWFSLLVDESRDIAKIEQLSVCLRYIKDGSPREEFIGFWETDGLSAIKLCDQIIKILHEFGVDIQNTAGQGYDGASVMSGRCRGVQSLFRQTVPHAIYVHCYCHRLNLVIVDCCSSVPAAARFFALLQDLYVFISSSIPHKKFMELQNEMLPDFPNRELKRQSETRWICQWRGINTVIKTMGPLIATLEYFEEDHSSNERHTTADILLKRLNTEFAVCLILFEDILGKAKAVTVVLQSPDKDLSQAVELVQALQSDVNEKLEVESKWEFLMEKIQNLLVEHNFPEPLERRRRRVRHDTTPVVAKTKQDFREQVFIPCLKIILEELQRRFSNDAIDVMQGINSLNPKHRNKSTFLSVECLTKFSRHYNVHVDGLVHECAIMQKMLDNREKNAEKIPESLWELHQILLVNAEPLPILHQLSQISLILPITTASCERSFSSLRRVKIWLRNSMSEQRLSGLGLMALTDRIVDYDVFIDKFSQTYRRIQLK